jgi:hypothetical protein
MGKKNLFDFEFRTSINPEGTHSEFYWSQEFPRAIEWLFYDNTENPVEVNHNNKALKTKSCYEYLFMKLINKK